MCFCNFSGMVTFPKQELNFSNLLGGVERNGRDARKAIISNISTSGAQLFEGAGGGLIKGRLSFEEMRYI